MSQDNNENPFAFSSEQAAQIIVALINTQTLQLPFLKALKNDKLSEIHGAVLGGKELDLINGFGTNYLDAVTKVAANAARIDAHYLLALRQVLVTGFTEKEAKDIFGGITTR